MKTKSEKTRSFRHPSVYKYGRGQRFDVPVARPVQQQLPGVVGEKDFEAMRRTYDEEVAERGDSGDNSSMGESSVPADADGDTTIDYADGRDTIPQEEEDLSLPQIVEALQEDIETLDYLIFEFLNNMKGRVVAIKEKL